MTHNEKVAGYKAYFQTGNSQFIPSVYEKTAHVNEVQAWKSRWSKTADGRQGGCSKDEEEIDWCRKRKTGRVMSTQKKKDPTQKKKGNEKTARAGHPANVALARALSPGILPGMNPGGSKVHVSHNGDFNHDIAAFIEEGVDPGTRAYLRGEKTAAPEQRQGAPSLSDLLREFVAAQGEKTAASPGHRPIVPPYPEGWPSSPAEGRAPFSPVTAETLGAGPDVRGLGPLRGPVELQGRMKPGGSASYQQDTATTAEQLPGVLGGRGKEVWNILNRAARKVMGMDRAKLTIPGGSAGYQQDTATTLGQWPGVIGERFSPKNIWNVANRLVRKGTGMDREKWETEATAPTTEERKMERDYEAFRKFNEQRNRTLPPSVERAL